MKVLSVRSKQSISTLILPNYLCSWLLADGFLSQRHRSLIRYFNHKVHQREQLNEKKESSLGPIKGFI